MHYRRKLTLCLVAAVIAVTLGGSRAVAADAAKSNEMGSFMLNWLICGEFPNTVDEKEKCHDPRRSDGLETNSIGPAQKNVELAGDFWLGKCQGTNEDFTGGAVNGHKIALLDGFQQISIQAVVYRACKISCRTGDFDGI